MHRSPKKVGWVGGVTFWYILHPSQRHVERVSGELVKDPVMPKFL